MKALAVAFAAVSLAGCASVTRLPLLAGDPVAGDAAQRQRAAALGLADGDCAAHAIVDALLSAAENPSVVVSMASVRALRGRSCERVSTALDERLAHRDWRVDRRARRRPAGRPLFVHRARPALGGT